MTNNKDSPPVSPSVEDVDHDDDGLMDDDVVEVIEVEDDPVPEAAAEDEHFGTDNSDDHEVADNSTLTFRQHQGPVFCCDLAPSVKQLAASGGEDESLFVWNWTTGEVVVNGMTFKDSVVHTKFSSDGKMLAAADMAGEIRVLKFSDAAEFKGVMWKFDTSEVTWLDWYPGFRALLAGTDESELWMWKLPSGESKLMMGRGERLECAKLLPDGKRILAGYINGDIRIFDLKSGETKLNVSEREGSGGAGAAADGKPPNSSPVTAVACKADNKLVAVGLSNGEVKVLNSQAPGRQAVATFFCAKQRSSFVENGESSRDSGGSEDSCSVESVLFSGEEDGLLVTGTLDGVITVWDLSTKIARSSVNLGGGVVKMAWSKLSDSSGVGRQTPLLLVASLAGEVAVVDVKASKILARCTGHRDQVLDCSQTRDGAYVLTSSDDRLCKVFDVRKIIGGT